MLLRTIKFPFTMIIQKFRTATRGLGEYCEVKNELRVRKGRKLYRFTCMEDKLQFAVTGRPNVAIPLAPDATVDEFRRSIASLIKES